MLIQTTRFGRLQVDHADLLLMPHGLIGFESCRHWILIQQDGGERVAWLQSVGLANVAVPVVSPRRFAQDYRVHVAQRQMTSLHLRPEDQVYVLVVVSKNGLTLTANLKSPVVINATRRLAMQVVCNDDSPLALPIGLTGQAVATVSQPYQQRAAA